VAQALVEIEASIIDVSTESFDSLGIEWDYSRTGRGSVSVSPGSPNTGSGTGPSTTVGAPNVTTLVADAGRSLMTRIRALEGTGKARIVSRPKVLGTANRMASMIDKRQASVRVAGNLDANLFTIEAGTTLQVVPQVVAGGERREVRLSLFIEDGNFEGTVVDAIPVLKKTEIRTEAALLEGESLLIGGISVESEVNGRSGVTGLGRIPLLGALFRHDEGSKTRRERLFLITPKLVTAESRRSTSAPAAGSPQAVLPLVPAKTPPAPMPVPAPAPAQASVADPFGSSLRQRAATQVAQAINELPPQLAHEDAVDQIADYPLRVPLVPPQRPRARAAAQATLASLRTP
jgi:type III secretion protein C